jgi:two-component system, OmpR family, response regulator ChvI
MALAQVGSAGRGGRVGLALEDRLLRESLAMALAEEGFRILEFAGADAALSHIEAGNDVDALVVDGGAHAGVDSGAGADEEQPRARLRAARCVSPVYVLSAHGDAGAAAERWGAAGVIDRSQPIASIKRNLSNAIRAGVLLGDPAAPGTARSRGPLTFSAEGTRVTWKGCHLDLSPTERALLSGLVAAAETGLTTRRAQVILAALDEPDADDGAERVKSLVRRLRKKFREVDPGFDEIVFVPGRGYSWREARTSEIVR